MRSKFSPNIILPFLFGMPVLLSTFGVLIPVIITPSSAYLHRVGALIALLIVFIVFYRIAKFRFNKIRIDKEALYIGRFLGCWTTRVPWNRVSGVERAIEQVEERTFKVIYIYVNDVKLVKITDFYYRNLYNLYRSLSKRTKVLGKEFSVLRREPEVETQKQKRLFILLTGAACVVMLGVSLYTGVERMIFSSTSVHVAGTTVELHNGNINRIAVSFRDQQGHQHWCFPTVTPSRLQQGELVQILFSPGNPDNACINTFKERWLLSVIYGVVGAGLGVGLILNWRKMLNK